MRQLSDSLLKQYLKSTGLEQFCVFVCKETDYLTAPASTKYHSAYDGGLADHCVRVTHNLLELSEKLGFTWDRPESPYIIGMFHDLCKVNFYKKTPKWTKDDNGKWVTVDGYEVDEKEVLGHGDKSCYFLLRHGVELTDQELYCIKYHMHVFGLGDSDQRNFGNACKLHPEILLVCIADHLAGIKEEKEDYASTSLL